MTKRTAQAIIFITLICVAIFGGALTIASAQTGTGNKTSTAPSVQQSVTPSPTAILYGQPQFQFFTNPEDVKTFNAYYTDTTRGDNCPICYVRITQGPKYETGEPGFYVFYVLPYR